MKKTAEERLKEKGITILTKHHSYEYLYKSFVDILNDFATQPSDELPSDDEMKQLLARPYKSYDDEGVLVIDTTHYDPLIYEGTKIMRSLASPLLASKDAENRELKFEINLATIHIEDLKARIKDLEEALKEIAEGKGRYSQDKLEHASNTIQDMIQLANNVLTPPKN